jgi:hypothetical protein
MVVVEAGVEVLIRLAVLSREDQSCSLLVPMFQSGWLELSELSSTHVDVPIQCIVVFFSIFSFFLFV